MEILKNKTKVAIFGHEPVTEKLGGMGIRQLGVARALSGRFDVRLFTPSEIGEHRETFEITRFDYNDKEKFREHMAWGDVVYVCQPSLEIVMEAKKSGKPLAIDLVPVFYFEELEHLQLDKLSEQETTTYFSGRVNYFNKLLELGDFFVCSNARERDYYLGMLTINGRLTPELYQSDPSFDSIIGIIPFGIFEEEPKKEKNILRGKLQGLNENDFLILWGSGIWNWYDSVTPVKAMARLKSRCPRAKMVFMSSNHPAIKKPPTEEAKKMRAFVEKENLAGQNVLFFDEWIPYNERGNYLLESDAGIVTARDHVENRFSFRIRVLDYLWADLPVLTNPGNVLADFVENRKLGFSFDFEDDETLADKIEWMASNPDECKKIRQRIKEAKKEFYWSKVIEPLENFCDNPTIGSSLFEKSRFSTSFLKLNELKMKKILYLRSSPLPHAVDALRSIRTLAPNAKIDIAIQPEVDRSLFGQDAQFLELPLGGFEPEKVSELLNGDSSYDTVICSFNHKDIFFYANVIEFASKIDAKNYLAFNDEYQFSDISGLCNSMIEKNR